MRTLLVFGRKTASRRLDPSPEVLCDFSFPVAQYVRASPFLFCPTLKDELRRAFSRAPLSRLIFFATKLSSRPTSSLLKHCRQLQNLSELARIVPL